MDAQGNFTIGEAYAYRILQKWVDLIEIGEKFRAQYIKGEPDQDLRNEYISRLTRLWGELRPHVEGRTEERFSKITAAYAAYSQYFYDPKKLSDATNAEDIFKLESCIRDAMHALKITQFEMDMK